jgi:hypothetical protein
MRHAHLALVFPLFLGLTACREDWMPSDVERGQALDALGEAGYDRLCSEFESYIQEQYTSSELVQGVCLALAVQSSETALACGEAMESCTSEMPAEAKAQLQAILAQASCARTEVEPTGCMATVGELEGCLNALEAKLEALKFGGACAALGEPIDEDWWKLQLPAACLQIQNRCTPQ